MHPPKADRLSNMKGVGFVSKPFPRVTFNWSFTKEGGEILYIYNSWQQRILVTQKMTTMGWRPWAGPDARLAGTFWATWLTQGEVQLLRSGPRGLHIAGETKHWKEAMPGSREREG